MSIQYRREVDGLRAIAVVPVILFHAGFSQFSGGYVGVDVFFVISGYLITSIIVSDLEKGSFSLLKFYERRARRILPALFLVIFCCLPFAWLWMSESKFNDFSGSIVDTVLFISNFYFWSNGGYFDPAADTRPLLHTWSLAVEEQFYILFPLLFSLIWIFGKTKAALLLLLIATFSLIICEIGWRYMPSANFYLLPSRAWELLAGALCAFVKPQISASIRNILSMLGLALIASAILLFDESTPFPSLLTLVPVIGTVLIILFGVRGTIVATLLSWPIFVGIGLVSYSAYLWHQPVFAFARIRSHVIPSETFMLFLILVVFALAYLSWRFVETPFRTQTPLKTQNYWPVPTGFAAISLLIVMLGIFQQKNLNLQNKVYLSQLSTEQQEMYEFLKVHQQDHKPMIDNRKCVFWAPSVSADFEERFKKCAENTGRRATVVIGDSHAMNIYNALAIVEFDPFLVSLSQGGCRPHEVKPNCQYSGFLQFVEQQSEWIDKIIFHQSGSYLLSDPDGRVDSMTAFSNEHTYNIVENNIYEIINYLEEVSAHSNLIWLGPFVEARIVFGPWLTRETLKFNPHSIKAFQKLDQHLLGIFATKNVSFKFMPMNTMLSPLLPSLLVGDCLIVRDADHFSRCGEAIVGDLVKEALRELELAKTGANLQ